MMEGVPTPVRQTTLGAGIGATTTTIGSDLDMVPHYQPTPPPGHHRSRRNFNDPVPHYQPVPGNPKEFGRYGSGTRAPPPNPIRVPRSESAPHFMPLVSSPQRISPRPNDYFFTPTQSSSFAGSNPSSRSCSPPNGRVAESVIQPPPPFQAYQPYSRSATPSSSRVPSSSEIRHDPQTPASPARPSHHPIVRGDGSNASSVDNFSRPRVNSRKQTQQLPLLDFPGTGTFMPADSNSVDSTGIHVTTTTPTMSMSPTPTDGMRSRGPSVSSALTASTSASSPLARSYDAQQRPAHDPSGSGSSASTSTSTSGSATPGSKHGSMAEQSVGAPAPSLSGTRLAAAAATPRLAGDSGATVADPRLSRMSQLTAAAAGHDRVAQRERASMLVRSGLLGTLVSPLSELSVEDVMDLYESGFNDTEPEDHDAGGVDSRPQTAWSAPNRASRSMLSHVMMDTTTASPPSGGFDGSEPSSGNGGGDAAAAAAAAAATTKLGGDDDDDDEDAEYLSAKTSINHSGDEEDDGYEPETDAPPPSSTLRQSRISRQSQSRRLSAPLLQQSPLIQQIASDEASEDETNTLWPKIQDTARPIPKPLAPEPPGARDRYGFKKENQYISRKQYDEWDATYEPYLERRRKKWMLYLKENSLMTSKPNRFPPRNNKTKRFVRKGIPPEWRGAAWFYYAGGPALLSKNPGVYARLVQQEAKEVAVRDVEWDLHRTFPDNLKFKPASHDAWLFSKPRHSASTRGGKQGPAHSSETELPIVSSLRRVLHAFSIHNPRIGYCQSLNFLAGMLLLFVESEEHAFWMLNIITHDFLPGTHEQSLEGSKVDLGVLMTSLHESMPAVWAKIAGDMDAEPTAVPRAQTSRSMPRTRMRRRDVPAPTDRLPPITLCMTAWFMSCFIGTLPVETTLRVWDVMFYEGSKTLFRIALAIFKLGENEIQAMLDPTEMFLVVQAIPRNMLDANALMEACFKRRNGFGHLSQETTDARRKERREQIQHERNGAYDGGGVGKGGK